MRRSLHLIVAFAAVMSFALAPVVASAAEGDQPAAPPAEQAAPPAEKPAPPPPPPPTKADLQAAINKLYASIGKLNESVKKLYDQRKAKDASALGEIFEKFSGDLDRSEDDLVAMRTAYAGLRTDLDSYYSTWKAEISAIKNDKIRKAGEKRLVDFNEKFDDVIKKMKEYDKALNSISSQLLDVRKYLKYDLRPAGVDQISGSLDDAADEIDDLKDDTSKMRKVLDQLPEKVAVAAK